MREHVLNEGFKIFIEKPEYGTIRVSVPEGHPLRAKVKDADFVLARKDGPSSDGRRPDYVEAGTLDEDLARRDFTINAMARDPLDPTGKIIDPFNGQLDLERKTIRFVGDPNARIAEDGLRALRAIRFEVTKSFVLEVETWRAVRSILSGKMLLSVSVERLREELNKMFHHDTLLTLRVLASLPNYIKKAIFRAPLHLTASLKEK